MKMKIALFGTIMMAATALFMSCGEKKHNEESAESDEMVEWAEMDSFHTIMADVFHPLKDSGNVQPIMERATELADEAEKWANAPLPAKVDNEEMKELLTNLKNGTRDLAVQIAEGTEEDIAGTRLHELHDLFHKIQEKWYGGGKEEHHDKH
jgi:hypothetical protein